MLHRCPAEISHSTSAQPNDLALPTEQSLPTEQTLPTILTTLSQPETADELPSDAAGVCGVGACGIHVGMARTSTHKDGNI